MGFELADYFFGDSEPEGIEIVRHTSEREIGKHIEHEIRERHSRKRKGIRDVSLAGFAVDHGLGAHSGNGGMWRTTPVAIIRLDYLKDSPLAYARLEKDESELLAQLAFAIAIQNRRI
jgi:hypothetical protein